MAFAQVSPLTHQPPQTYRHQLPVPAPVSGSVLPLSEAPDAFAAQEILGCGVMLKVSGATIDAPFNGIVEHAPASGYHLRLKADNGLKLNIQWVGNVPEYGERCQRFVRQGEAITQGQTLMRFDPVWLRNTQHSELCIITILNADKLAALVPSPMRQVMANIDNLFTLYL